MMYCHADCFFYWVGSRRDGDCTQWDYTSARSSGANHGGCLCTVCITRNSWEGSAQTQGKDRAQVGGGPRWGWHLCSDCSELRLGVCEAGYWREAGSNRSQGVADLQVGSVAATGGRWGQILYTRWSPRYTDNVYMAGTSLLVLSLEHPSVYLSNTANNSVNWEHFHDLHCS